MEFYWNGELLGSDTTPTPSNGFYHCSTYYFDRPAPGTYSLVARVYDNDGAFTDSAPRSVLVEAPPPPPTVTTGNVSTTSVSAYLVGAVNAHGASIPSNGVTLEYGTTEAYGSAITSDFMRDLTGVGDIPIYMSVPGLQRNTTYHCRLVVTTWTGTGYGQDVAFTTPANLPPYAQDTFSAVPGTDPVTVYLGYSDPDPDDAATLTSISTPAHGTITRSGAYFIYTPDSTFEDQDECTYTVSDEHGGSTTATIRLANVRKMGPGRYVTNVITETGRRRAAGEVAVNVTVGGNFTGVLVIYGERYPFRGRFSAEGYWSSEFDPVGRAPFTVSLGRSGSKDGMMIGGYISGSLGEFMIEPDAALEFPKFAPEEGRYTVSLQPDKTSIPQGDGYVSGRVSKHGRVGFVGRIGDGQAFSFGTQIRRGGTAQFYAVAGEAPKDRLYGRFQFPSSQEMPITGEFVWYKAARTTGYYQEGFTTQLNVAGSRFENPGDDEPILDYTGAIVELGINIKGPDNSDLITGSLTTPNPNEKSLTFASASPVTALSDRRALVMRPQVQISMNRARGTFSGNVRLDPASSRTNRIRGVLLQHQNTGSGHVIIDGQSAAVVITPK